MSWIASDDLVQAVERVLTDETFGGPVNASSPNPVRNEEFTRILARVLRRPAFLTVPSIALEVGLGEMARELILSSARVQPARLLEAGFQFRYPGLEDALRHELEAAQ